MHLPQIITTAYYQALSVAETVTIAEHNGFIISKQVVNHAFMDMADTQWLADNDQPLTH